MTIVAAAFHPDWGSVIACDGNTIGPHGMLNTRRTVKWSTVAPSAPGGQWAVGFAGDSAFARVVAGALARVESLPLGEPGALLIAEVLRGGIQAAPGSRPTFEADDDSLPSWGVAPIVAHSSGVWQLCSDLWHVYPGFECRGGFRVIANGHAREVAMGAMWGACEVAPLADPLAVVQAGIGASFGLVAAIGGEATFMQLRAPGGG